MPRPANNPPGRGRLDPARLPKVSRLFEAHLTVRDLDRSVAFYRDTVVDGIELRDRVRLELDLLQAQADSAAGP